jgi:hypothetical protein
MSEQKKNSGWPELGQIVKNSIQKRNEDGTYSDVLDANGNKQYKLSFKLAAGIGITLDGQQVRLNKGRTGMLKNPIEEIEGLYKAGQIDDDKIESRRESAKKAHSWLRYKVQLPPPRD